MLNRQQSRTISILVITLTLLLGCSADGVKRTAYEAIYQRNCLDRYGSANCEAEHKSYDNYKYEREQSLKAGKS